MAFTAREVVMTFRGQNYLSSALRRVGRDVGSLSRVSAISQQRAAAAIASARARNSLTTTRAEQAALSVTGSRAIALEQRRLQLGINEQRQVAQISGLYQERLALQRDQILNEERLLRLYEAQAEGQAFVGRGTNRIATSEAIKASEADYARLAERVQYLTAQEDIQLEVMQKSSVAAQRLAADYAAQAARVAQLTEQERAQIAAVEQRALVEQRLAVQEQRILPVQQWQDRARAVEHFGRVLQMTGLIATAVLGASARAAANLSTQVTLAATQARPPGAGAEATARIRDNTQKQVMSLMRQLPFNGQDFADAFYQVFSGTNVQNVAKATSMIQAFGKAAVAGGTDLKTMVDAGITLHNVFGNEFKTPTAGMNAFLAAVRYGRMNAGQFANSLPNVVAIAKRVGLSFYDIAGAMAALTRQTGGRFTNRDATGIARMVEVFARPDFIAGAKKMGVTIKDIHGNMRPLVDIITEFAQKTRSTGGIDAINLFKTITSGGSTSGTGGTAGTIQARRAFSFLINDAQQYRSVTKLVRQDNTELARSFEVMSHSPGIRWTLFINQLKVLAYEVGNAVIPVFASLAPTIEKFSHWFTNLSPHTQHLIGEFAAIGAIGTLLAGVFSGIAGSLGVMVTQFMLWRRARAIENILELRNAAIRTEAALSGLGEAGIITARGALGLGIPAAIALLVIYHKQVGEVINALGGLQAVVTSLAVGTAVFFVAKWIPQIIRMVTELRAAVAVMKAMRAAAITAAAAETAIGVASAEAAGGVAILEGALLTLFSPEILAGLAAVAAALLIIKGAQSALDRPSNQATKTYTKILRDKNGNLFEQTRTSERGPGAGRVRPITQQQAEGLGLIVNHPRDAINQAIKDSPRYQHAIGANQQSVNKFNKELEREARLVNQIQVRHAIAEIQKQPSLTGSIDNLRHLKTVAEQSPDIKIASQRWNAYYTALNTLISGKTKAQQQAIRQILNSVVLSAALQKLTPTDWIAKLERARLAQAAHPSDLKTQIAYEKAQEQLNQAYKSQPALLAAINDVLSSFDSNIKSTTDSANTLGTTFQDVLSGVKGMYQNFKQTETSLFGDLFNGPFVNNPLTQNRLQWGSKLTGNDLLKDLHSQVSNFNHFHSRIDSLRRRGAPQELVNQLMAAGDSVQNMQNLAALQSLNPQQLQEYFRTFNQGQRLIQQETMRDLNNQLKIYRRHGRNIALAIIAGIQDENVGVTNALTKMIHKMFPGLPVGATGAGGRPTHHPEKQTVVVKSPDVHVHTDKHDENTPAISKKAKQRHVDLRTKNRASAPFGGPR